MSSRLVIGYSLLRAAYAVALLIAPGRTARPWFGDVSERAGTTIAARGLGARDGVLAAGAIAAVASGRSPSAWLAGCAVSDAVDVAATVTADGSELPARSKPGTAVAAGSFGVAAAVLAWRSAR